MPGPYSEGILRSVRTQVKAQTMVKAKEVLSVRPPLAFGSLSRRRPSMRLKGLLSGACWQEGPRQRWKQEQVTQLSDGPRMAAK